MKYVKLLVLTVIVVSIFLACDDDDPEIMDLAFPQPGFMWMVLNNNIEPIHGKIAGLYKWSYNSGMYDDGIATPFACSNAYDSACGDGKVWVTGSVWYGDDEVFKLWEALSDESIEIDFVCVGLTYDGELLWGADTDVNISDTITEFVNINPVNYAITDVFTYHTTTEEYLSGLAWSDAGLWSLFSKYNPPDPPENKNEFVLFDPETGEDIYHIDCSIEYAVGLAWDGEALWTNDKYRGITYRIDPKNGEVLGYVDVDETHNRYPYGLCFEATGDQ